MGSFLAIHHNGVTSRFTSFDTVEEARGHLASLINSRKVNPADSMAIVRTVDDSIVYFRQSNNTVASLNFEKPSLINWLKNACQHVGQELQHTLEMAFTTLRSTH